MKNLKSPLLAFILVLPVLLAGCQVPPAANTAVSDKNTAAESLLSVYTSFYPMYDFAVKIGGGQVIVNNLVPAGTEPHDWEPTATDIVNLENADIFIYNGAGMENWVQDVLDTIENKDLITVEASQGIPLLADSEAGGGTTERGGLYDPHVWLNPLYAQKEMEQIKQAFSLADPEHQAYYEANYEHYVTELAKLDQEYKDTLSPLANKDIIVAHQAFGYLCSAYGLNQIPIEGLSADSEPDPARMADIINYAHEHQIKVIFFEELVSPKVAEIIAAAIGAKTEVLNPLEGLNDEQKAAGADYFSVMRQNLATLKEALQT
ncbi:MAG: metal ABC transporter substrate-binding protein [Clostridiaceae bacterium]|nr:metal ABC transporter substrate-binding protein [Clostridiaceae bacterium]